MPLWGLQGDRVAYGWIRDACKTCANCLKGEENICKTGYSGLILNHFGGFQARLRAPSYMAIKLPDAIDSVDAAPLMCAGQFIAPLFPSCEMVFVACTVATTC